MALSDVLFALGAFLCAGTGALSKWRATTKSRSASARPPANTTTSNALALVAIAVLALPFGVFGSPSAGALAVIALVEAGLLTAQIRDIKRRWPR